MKKKMSLFKKLEEESTRGLKTRCQSRRTQAYLLSQNLPKPQLTAEQPYLKIRTYQKDILYPKTEDPQDGRGGCTISDLSIPYPPGG